MANLLGFDIHRYNNAVDPQVAKDAGIHFALIRAGGIDYYGKCYTDDFFERNSEVFPDFMPVGYWFVFRPNFDPHMQANYFVNLIRDKRHQIPAAFDVELKGVVNQETFKDNLLAAFSDLDAAFPNDKHINYTRAGFFNSNVAPDPRWALYDLWVARYTSWPQPWGNPNDASYVYPRDWETWVFWQWSADGNGRGQEFGAPPPPLADHDMDLDYFNGDLDAFNKYFSIGQGLPKIVEVTNNKNITGKDVPKGINEHVIPLGTRLGVISQETANDGSVWYNVGGMWVLASQCKVIE